MITEAIASTTSKVKGSSDSMVELTKVRKKAQEDPQQVDESSDKQQVQPEELLNQIKSLTEEGQYAVQFEKDRDLDELVVKIVNSETKETIRQIPAEELLKLTQHLKELRGNIVDTVS